MGTYKPSTPLNLDAGRALGVEAIWGEPLRRAQAQGGGDAATGAALYASEDSGCATGMKLSSPPSITIRNAQRRVLVSTRKLRRLAGIACKLVWQNRRRKSEIASLNQIYILIVGDRRMATLHQEFCGIPDATDVLTFQHGEIVISADTAATQARMFHTSVSAEIQLYLLHGLLHLAGFDDTTPSKRRQMHRIQKRLFTAARRSNP
jgi:probable rRNA maturation factor